MVQIETQEALDAVEEIVLLVDALFIVPFDLGNSIGFPILDSFMAPELNNAITKILRVTKTARKKCGIFCTSGEQARQCASMGFDMISVATDVTTLELMMKESVTIAKGTAGPEDGKSQQVPRYGNIIGMLSTSKISLLLDRSYNLTTLLWKNRSKL